MIYKNKKTSLLVTLLMVFILISSCTSSKPTIASRIKPSQYSSNLKYDSINNWSLIFNDQKLKELIDTARINNFDLKNSIQQIEIADAYYQMSKGAFYPSLQANIGIIPSSESFKDYSPIGTYANFTSSWELDIWGRLKDRKESAKMRMLASSEGVRLIKTTLTADIAKAYFELQRYDQELEIMEKNIRLQNSAFEMVKVQKMAGKATNLAVLQFEAQLLNSQTQLYKIKRQITTTESLLNLLLNRTPRAIPIDKSRSTSQSLYDFEQGVSTNLLTNRPDILAAALQAQAAGFDVEAARKAFYPSLVISANVGVLSSSPNLLFNAASLTWGVINNLTLPIFQNKQLKFNLKIKEAERKQALLNYQYVYIKGINEIQSCISKIKSLNNEIDILEKEVKVLENAEATSHDLFAYGYANYLEVINAQKNIREAEIELIRTKNERSQLSIDLYRALGGSN